MFDELISVKEGLVPVKPDSLLFCYTDGVVETENDKEEYFGMHRLSSLLKRNQHITPRQINEYLITEVVDFKKNRPYADDIAIMCGKGDDAMRRLLGEVHAADSDGRGHLECLRVRKGGAYHRRKRLGIL